MDDFTRRRFLRMGVVAGTVGFAGCSRLTGGSDIEDSDGDGVINSEDYAPRDASVQRAEQVQEVGSTTTTSETQSSTDTPTETVTKEPTARTLQPSGRTVVDGFEDGDTSGWSPVVQLASSFSASQERVFAGSWSAKLSEGGAQGDRVHWQKVGSSARPTKLETAYALENGEIYSDSFTEWYLGETIVFRVNYNWSNGFLAVNGSGAEASENTGAVVADLPWPSSDRFFYVVLDNVDWNNYEVGRVKVNGVTQAESVPFFNNADSIDRTGVLIGGGGGNVIYTDETTVPVS